MGTFTPEVHATACVAGEAILNALQAWRQGLGAPYWPSRASDELGGMEQAMRAARRNLAEGSTGSLSYPVAFEQACRFLTTMDTSVAEQLRDLEIPLFSLVGELSKDLGCPQELYTVLMFYQRM